MIGWAELLVIIVALVVLKPEGMIEAARFLGKVYAEYNKLKKDLLESLK